MKVSVIIPTFKRSNSLSRAIDSVLNQSYKNIEVLVVDDNNPNTIYREDVVALMKLYEKDKRVVYIQHSRNLNGAVARNTGIRRSTGEIICFLDDDDYFLPKKIEKQLDYLLKNKKYQGVYCGSFIKGKERISKLEGNLSKNLLLKETILFTPTLMFYKNIIEDLNGFDENYKRHQDYEFLLRFFTNYQIGVIQNVLVVIGDNDGENRLTGIDFEIQKSNFLNQFEPIITELNSVNGSFRTKVYSKHYAEVFFSHLKNKYFKLGLVLFIKYFFKSPYYFTKYLIFRFYNYLNYRLKIN